MPILHAPGVITPGQLGPMSLDLEPTNAHLALTMSKTGMPSVIQITKGISDSIASSIDSAAYLGGT